MSKELEIRAAKTLGCEYQKECNDFKITSAMKKALKIKDKGAVFLHTDAMKFTTSYDWAMLGLKRLMTKKQFFEIVAKLMQVAEHPLLATPEQLTQAWCEVLEATDEN